MEWIVRISVKGGSGGGFADAASDWVAGAEDTSTRAGIVISSVRLTTLPENRSRIVVSAPLMGPELLVMTFVNEFV